MSSDASDSGERKSTSLEKTHISLRSALVVGALGLIPLTLFIASLSAGQAATNVKIDSLNSTMTLLNGEVAHRVEDHEVRLRTLEARKP